MLKPEIIGHHFLHLLSPPRLSLLFYESESSWRQRDQQIVAHGPHIITKNNSFEIKVSPPRSPDSLSSYFLWLRMVLCRNIEGFLSILKKTKYCALVRCVKTREFLTTRFRRGKGQDTQVLLSYHNLRRVSVFHVPVLMNPGKLPLISSLYEKVSG